MTITQANVTPDAFDLGRDHGQMDADWILWQLADSAFPTGGFAHSGGVEAAWQHGRVRSVEDLEAFLSQAMHQLASGIVPFMTACFDQLERVSEWDRWLDVTLSNHVANRASRLQGLALLATGERIFQTNSLKEFRKAALAENAPCHLAVVFGFLARDLNLARKKAIKLFIFLAMRGVLSAAVRMGIVGPMQAQRIQIGMTPALETLVGGAAELDPREATQTAPLLELMQSTQDRLYSRLFQS